MTRIVIVNWAKKTLEVSDHTKTLLRHFHDHHLDWMHSCGGKGRCTSCKAVIAEGKEHFSPLTPAEHKYRQMGALSANERLSCQAKISGNVAVIVPDEYKLPHIDYNRQSTAD